jgi:hypothetical protein
MTTDDKKPDPFAIRFARERATKVGPDGEDDTTHLPPAPRTISPRLGDGFTAKQQRDAAEMTAGILHFRR